ncbi:uridine kinase [Rossellomorea aquimaris]|uniref:Uridine kinase n=1 Tax=Rossellomorea aquimaris TaxID=189382 RepID=A0A1J6W347_9BACI|nr:uridine kinase [Rossellomorea aquimaris]
MNRTEVLNAISKAIMANKNDKPLRVGISGITSSGKTTLANELSKQLGKMGVPVIQARMDDFHNPKSVRYQRGRESAEGYYLDAYDHQSLLNKLLIPLGPNGNRQYSVKSLDLSSDQYVDSAIETAKENSLLLIDGTFLFKDDLRKELDFMIYVQTDIDIALERGSLREQHALGGLERAKSIFIERYHAASRMYLDEHEPAKYADMILVNNDLDHPELIVNNRK